MFAAGRGYSEYKASTISGDSKATLATRLITTRFFSSSITVLDSLYKSYKSLVRAFIQNRETASPVDAVKFKVRGQDFAVELVLMLDIFTPIKDLLERCQRVEQYIWNSILWIRDTLERLDRISAELEQLHKLDDLSRLPSHLFPHTRKHAEELGKRKFFDLELLDGWLTRPSPGRGKSDGVEWVLYEPEEYLHDVADLSKNLKSALRKRYQDCSSPLAHLLDECLNPRRVLQCLTGSRSVPDGRPKLDQGNNFKLGGVTAFHTFFNFVCSLPHVKKRQSEEDLDFDPQFSNETYFKFCTFIHDCVWGKSGFSLKTWFPELPEVSSQLVKMSRCVAKEEKYEFSFSIGNSFSSSFDEAAFFKSFYVDKKVFEKVGQELCTALDVAVSMGGCEAVVESFYSVVDTQQKGGNMSNETLEVQVLVTRSRSGAGQTGPGPGFSQYPLSHLP
ncbi:uncharacterized protein LOC125179542 [Hyalella azteca]|uniref:Uncharacterized protein LOC125179542 n=1 Tax=Hyalella azteca TaxID=294128 RepID=A0A979FXS4_HYAAZ|nr:uncharacterized protein LOC125179542 [Hyalella azteca]